MSLPGQVQSCSCPVFVRWQRQRISCRSAATAIHLPVRADFIHPGTGCNSLSEATRYRCISSGTSISAQTLDKAFIGEIFPMISDSKKYAPPVVPLLPQR